MSLRIRRVALANFRKFRDPIVIDGLIDGLNIVIEPNETGKSTLLDALRAAFFVRHSTRNQLAQSYASHGDAAAPSIEVAFEAGGADWTIAKRFLRSPSVEVNGPIGRAQGDAAEAALQELLGSVRDTSQQGNPAAYGALGLLWVGQAEALAVAPPNDIVRQSVSSVLETEVGAIMGGAAFERVRAQVVAQHAGYWTATGRPTGQQSAARLRLEAAETASRAAEAQLAALEQAFDALEAARARLRVVERELADDADLQQRADLARQLEVARTAAQVLATRQAEAAAAQAAARGLQELNDRHVAAQAAGMTAREALDVARRARLALAGELERARTQLTAAQANVAAARQERQAAKNALEVGQGLQQRADRRAAVAAACRRHTQVLALEAERSVASEVAATLIPAEAMAALDAGDRQVAAARAATAAGATRLEIVGRAPALTIDGEPFVGERIVTCETRIGLGDGAELIVRPPAGSASAAAGLADAEEKQRLALAALGVADLAAARQRCEAAREAAGEARTLDARIAAAAPADDRLGLAAGADALKLFIAGLHEPEVETGAVPALADLERLAEAAEASLVRAEVLQEAALSSLREAEAQDLPLAAAEAGAERDLANADAQIAEIEARPDFAGLDAALVTARQAAAAAVANLIEAEANATAHDTSAIARAIATIDKRAKAANDSRADLANQIARLETTIEIEGGKGLAARAAAAREEYEAAAADHCRVSEDAEVLQLLASTLEAARVETARAFAGPVARRARRHVERLLPGCDLSFADDLGLDAIVRGGVSERCQSLSKGTQEQLAVLTRIAFADMLLEQACPVSLILDDPLVYSDDARLDAVTDILMDTASRMQVILLTCRDRAFRHVPANRVRLSPSLE